MNEQIYGYLSAGQFQQLNEPFSELDVLQQQACDGLVLLDPQVTDRHEQLGAYCRERGLKLILGFTDSPTDPNLERLERAKSITSMLAVATTPLAEWVGNAYQAQQYRRMGDRWGFQWVCTLTHKNVLFDLKRGRGVQKALENTLCLCLCGYVLAGYLFDEPRMPHLGRETTLGGRNLHKEFGVTVENLSNYLRPMNILSGAGWQPGLNVGSRVYARQLSFKGMVIGMPFDLTGTDTITIKPPPPNYPVRCGE